MAEPELLEGTLAPEEAHGEGLPQLAVETYTSQLFWLVVTFGFLMFVMSRFAIPNIRGALDQRHERIQGDLDAAEQLRSQAADSLQAYEAALAGARGRALALADENRKRVMDEVEALKGAADEKSQVAMAEAEQRIATSRSAALAQVRNAAQEAVAEIVERLIGERVSATDAANAIEAGG